MSSSHYKEYESEPGLDESRLMVGGHRFSLKHLLGYFVGGAVGGIVACLSIQSLLSGKTSACARLTEGGDADVVNIHARGEPWAGSAQVGTYPPPSPTNYFPSLFPTDVGYAGATPTGAEPAIIATAPSQPLQTGAAALVAPAYTLLPNSSSNVANFSIFRAWGNLSPWYSVPLGAFGINEGSAPPAGCDVQGMYLLYRHGARYPGGDSGPQYLAKKLSETTNDWNATGNLAFLNSWTYKLGEESFLTAFGRQQEFDLGVSMRLKYGFLLDNFTAENRLPVFRTTSEDRMLASGINFALGFFGWPTDGQYEQVVMIESSGFNNTLSPWDNCPNSNDDSRGYRSETYIDEWISVYLAGAQERIQAELQGFNLTLSDVYSMQEMCAYETVSVGYSAFCELFTEEEWEGFGYAIDLAFWYDSAFGSPVGRVQGLGWVQELVSRLTLTPIEIYNSSTNSTWDSNPETFPLGNVLYADSTHDVVIANILTALNLSTLATTGPLPATEMPANRSFRTSQLVPFGSNVQFQLLSCPDINAGSDDGSYMRIVINDGAVPLTGIGECPENESGLCPLSTFTAAELYTSETVDWNWGCNGNWSVPPGTAWNTTGGWYPPPPSDS